MQKIQFDTFSIHEGYLQVINQAYPIQKPIAKEALLPITNTPESVYLERTVATALQTALTRLRSTTEIAFVSGYRTLQEQIAIYHDSTVENGLEYTQKYVALPNHSEHQTGYAIDLTIEKESYDFICPSFPTTGIANEFRQIAVNYGFIERYPKGKEAITHIAYEPWHFRYVGYPHSVLLKEGQMCLEEYVEWIKQFTYTRPYQFNSIEKKISIFYVPKTNDDYTVSMEEDAIYQVSGNNMDGFIVTVWRDNHG